MSHGVPETHAQSRRWIIVAYAGEDYAWLKASTPKAFCCAKEVGSNGKEHFQIYAKWESNKRWSWFKDRAFKDEEGKHSLHWEPAKGPEWKCRRYIVDVASYLKDEAKAHHKTQGEVLDDFGCEVMLDKSAPTDQRVVKALVDGAALYQIFRENPMYYFHNGRKIKDLHADILSWKECGFEYKPSNYQDYKRRKVGPGEAPDDGSSSSSSS